MDEEDELAYLRVPFDQEAHDRVLERMQQRVEFDKMVELQRRHR